MLLPRKTNSSGLAATTASQIGWSFSWLAQDPNAILLSGSAAVAGCGRTRRSATIQKRAVDISASGTGSVSGLLYDTGSLPNRDGFPSTARWDSVHLFDRDLVGAIML